MSNISEATRFANPDYQPGTLNSDIDGPRPPRGVRLPLDAIEEADVRTEVQERFCRLFCGRICDALGAPDEQDLKTLGVTLRRMMTEAGI